MPPDLSPAASASVFQRPGPAAARCASPLAVAARNAVEAVPRLPLPGRGRTLARWRALGALAADDVCLAKVVEAHYDAQAILADIENGGTVPGELYAVWAAEPPDAQASFVADRGAVGTGHLYGTKAWCSGADLVDRALLTAVADGQRVLVEVPLAQPGVSSRQDGWHAVGMGRVHSGRVTFDGAVARQVGAAGAYLERPGFWHGGAGIAACWFGASSAIGERLRTHPRVATDPHAAAHLGAVDTCLSAAAALLRETAATIDAEPEASHMEAVLRLRSLIERAATEVIDRVGRALGPGPMCEDAAHARRCADLTTFVRQCHAERDLAVIGTTAARSVSGWTL